MRVPVLAASGLALAAALQACQASDWGYENMPPLPAPGRPASEARQPLPPKPPPARGQARPPAAAMTAAQAEVLALDSWVELFCLAAAEEADEKRKGQWRAYMKGKLAGGARPEVMSILSFWPGVRQAISASAEQKENYRDLFRALLRMKARSAATCPPELKAVAASLGKPAPRAGQAAPAPQGDPDGDFIATLLGPLRIAMTGNPPLTEDAIDAYADMTCFLYEQQHPDKSIDAADNRIIFAKSICDKFSGAPSDKDRLAICNFDVTWAKFKVLWAGGDAQRRLALLSRFSSKSGQAAPVDPLLDSVLKNGPWLNKQVARK